MKLKNEEWWLIIIFYILQGQAASNHTSVSSPISAVDSPITKPTSYRIHVLEPLKTNYDAIDAFISSYVQAGLITKLEGIRFEALDVDRTRLIRGYTELVCYCANWMTKCDLCFAIADFV